ncbi:MAG: CDP-alcohol phosphatidyltransferase [Gammaproteobacteria bacterium]|nr:MAG: CDP-alcohol phosphatidyltransferase [Gammaproteobacteria bacterium]
MRAPAWLTIPNAMSLLRLLLAPVLLLLAFQGRGHAFLAVVVVAFLLDYTDGTVARLLHQVSELGDKLDSWGDFAIFTTYFAGAWLLWPETMQRQALWMGLVAASIAVPVLVALLRFGETTAYHTWSVKLASGCTAPASIILFLGGPDWPFHAATFLCLLAAAEETAITLLLDRPRTNIRSVLFLLRDSPRRHGGHRDS